MKLYRFIFSISIFLSLSLFIVSCSSVPITGRKQLSLVPSSHVLAMSFQQYSEFLQTNKVDNSSNQAAMVKRVGQNIQRGVEKYFADHNLSEELKNYQWEFNLVESPEVNAWCMPGGKVVVYSGILPVTKDEAGLAVVMGHEIAHAIAEHGNERLSQGLLTQLGGMALSEAVKNEPGATQQLYMTAFGIGAQVGVLLPFSRTHESEADRLGLIFMSIAGYDPNEAVTFWQRMAAQKQGGSPPEFLSTHPSDETRIRKIRENLPEALSYYNK